MISTRECCSSIFHGDRCHSSPCPRPPSDGSGRSNEGSQEHGASNPKSNAFSNMSLLSFPSKGPQDPTHANRVQGAAANVPRRAAKTKSLIPSNFVEGEELRKGAFAATAWFTGKLAGKVHENGAKEPDQGLIIRVIMKEATGAWLSYFQCEEQILRTLKHRFILPCLGWWEMKSADGYDMVLMPFPRCQLPSMEELYEESPGNAIPEARVRQYAGQISQAIL